MEEEEEEEGEKYIGEEADVYFGGKPRCLLKRRKRKEAERMQRVAERENECSTSELLNELNDVMTLGVYVVKT